MLIQFTLQDLLILIAYLVGISAGIFLLVILWNINKTFGVVRSLLEDNQEEIKRTINTIPGTFENLEKISGNVKEASDELKVSVPVIVRDVGSMSKVARDKVELAGAVMDDLGAGISDFCKVYKKEKSDYMAYFPIFKDVFLTIYSTIASRKK